MGRCCQKVTSWKSFAVFMRLLILSVGLIVLFKLSFHRLAANNHLSPEKPKKAPAAKKPAAAKKNPPKKVSRFKRKNQ